MIRFIDRRDNQCAYIAEDPKTGARAPEIRCCGEPTINSTVWCRLHHGIVYLPVPKRLRVAA